MGVSNAGGLSHGGALGGVAGVFLTEARRARRWGFECMGGFRRGLWEVWGGVFSRGGTEGVARMQEGRGRFVSVRAF